MLKNNPFNEKKGFTLLEAIVAGGITIVAIGIISAIYFSGKETWETHQTYAQLQAEARLAMHTMGSELRMATRKSTATPSPNIYIPSSPNNTEIYFYLPADIDGDGTLLDSTTGRLEWDTDNIIAYRFNATGKTLLRQVLDNASTILSSKIISQDISAAQFSDIGINNSLKLTEVRIALNLSRETPNRRNITTSISSIIKLRN